MSFDDNPLMTVLLLAAIVVTVLVTGCIEEEELEIDGVVVDRAPPIGNPDYERQEYWIVVEAANLTRYRIEGEGIWLGYNITDKFHKTVPPGIVKEIDEPPEEEEESEDSGIVWIVAGVLVILCLFVLALWMRH